MKIIGVPPALYTVYRFAIKPIFKSIFKSIIDEELSQKRDDAIRYMNDAWRYRNEAKETEEKIAKMAKAIAQDKAEVAKIAKAINSQLASLQASEKLRSTADKTKGISKAPDHGLTSSAEESRRSVPDTRTMRALLTQEALGSSGSLNIAGVTRALIASGDWAKMAQNDQAYRKAIRSSMIELEKHLKQKK